MVDTLGPLHDAPPPPAAAVAIRVARAKLTMTPRSGSIWPVLGAAALAAVSALALASAVILGPPPTVEPVQMPAPPT